MCSTVDHISASLNLLPDYNIPDNFLHDSDVYSYVHLPPQNYQDKTMDEQQYHDDITDQEPVQPVNLIPAKQQMPPHH